MEIVYDVQKINDFKPPTYFVCNSERTHTMLCLSHKVQKFTDRVEVRFDTGGGLGVSLFPDAIAAFQAIRKTKNNLVVFKFEPAKNDTVVYETTQGVHSVMDGIAFQAGPGESFRVHVSVMGQHIAFLVDSQQLLTAIAELGGDPE